MKGAEFLDRRAEDLMIRNVDWSRYELDPDDAAKVRDASTYRQALKDYFLTDEQRKGLALPWNKAIGIRIRNGETSIWTGFNKARKSMLLGLIQLGLIAQGARTCIMSFEMKPVITLQRMARQFIGNDEPTIPALEDYFNWLTGKMWLYDQLGSVKPERVLAVVRYAITELGCTQIVIDSLMKCNIRKDSGWDRQIQFIDNLCTMSRDTGAHIHLVAHAKKPERHGSGPPGRYDIKGAGEISDMTDNVFIVYASEDEDEQYNAQIVTDKQREAGEPNPYGFVFDERNFQFKPYASSRNMIPEDWKSCNWQ